MEDKARCLDPITLTILEILERLREGRTCLPNDVAQLLAARRRKAGDPPDLWRRYLQTVSEQARFLARAGRIGILRGGVCQDPHAPIEGLIRLSLPQPGE